MIFFNAYIITLDDKGEKMATFFIQIYTSLVDIFGPFHLEANKLLYSTINKTCKREKFIWTVAIAISI